MSDRDRRPPAPSRQQAPPTRAAASDSRRSLRDARGALPLTPGDGLAPSQNKAGKARDDVMIRIDTASWQQGFDAGLSALWSDRHTLAASIDRWSWISGYIEGDAARLTRGSRAPG